MPIDFKGSIQSLANILKTVKVLNRMSVIMNVLLNRELQETVFFGSGGFKRIMGPLYVYGPVIMLHECSIASNFSIGPLPVHV